MMKYVLSLRKPSPSGSPQKRGGKEGWARKNGRPPCYSQPKGFLRVELRFCTSTSQSQVSFKKYPPEVAVSNCVPMGHFTSGMKKLSPCHYIRMFLIRDQRATFLSHKHWENVLLWHFNWSNTFVCNEDAWKWCSNYPIVVFFNIKIILLCTKYSLKIKLKVNTVDSSITRSGFRPKGNMIHLKTSKKKKENTIIERKIFLSGQKQFYKNLNFSRTCFNSVLYFPIWYGPSLNVFSMNTESGLGILYVYEHVWVYKTQSVFIICVHKIHIPVHILCSHPWKQHRGCDYAL